MNKQEYRVHAYYENDQNCNWTVIFYTDNPDRDEAKRIAIEDVPEEGCRLRNISIRPVVRKGY